MLDIPINTHQSHSTVGQDTEITFGTVAASWMDREAINWTPRHEQIVRSSFQRDLIPALGHRPIRQITTTELFAVLKDVEERGARHVVKRLNQRCRQVFQFAMLLGVCAIDPAAGLSKAFKSPKVVHRPALSEHDMPELWLKLKDYSGSPAVRIAFQLLITTFVRPGELRKARWEEIHFEKALWIIPAHRMKMRREHIVPLSPLAIDLLEELVPHTGRYDLLFPGARDSRKPISDVTLLMAIKKLGFGGRCVPHGFRATAASILSERNFAVDAIERQLAHLEHNKVKAAYHRAEYLQQRREMMDWWGHYLTTLSSSDRDHHNR